MNKAQAKYLMAEDIMDTGHIPWIKEMQATLMAPPSISHEPGLFHYRTECIIGP